MSAARGQRPTESKLRNDAEINKRQLELRGFARVDEVAMRKQRRSTADRCALDGGDQRFIEVDQRAAKPRLRTDNRSGWVLQEILEIIAGAKRVSDGIPEDD